MRNHIDVLVVSRGMRAKGVVGVCVVALLLTACASGSDPSVRDSDPAVAVPGIDTQGRKSVQWTLVGEAPGPADAEFKVDAAWIACTSGSQPEDPEPQVEYGDDKVTLTIWAIPPEGNAFTCQGNPATRVTVTLSEPLGDRVVVQGSEEPY